MLSALYWAQRCLLSDYLISILTAMFSMHGSPKFLSMRGHMVEYLPTYSPVLNPIEHKWAQAKCKKRALGCETDILFALNIV
ncbi:transposase [Arsenophonus endosymbiont of Bemisia tabaci]|uniref:transposase n=1 Tax=Arsenophonus endosymbiont of Bemisia tabaci TaxID=536059 RepID=UPI001765F062|nr:transposase [Arsenophonus endosymbiont of Bemisia tabaci]CAA2930549.1 hypothetical protein ARSQ2_01682 [Arsenophonus endosymbiont of Bemisia tabaci Q2]